MFRTLSWTWSWCAVLAALLLGVSFNLQAQSTVAVPALQARVTDLTQTLRPEQRAALEARLAQIEQRKGAQVVILMVPTTQPETIEQFALRVAEAWKIGRGRSPGTGVAPAPVSAIDDGVLIVVAQSDRRMRLEVGYGLEGALPDAVAKRIVSERMAPRFREGDFAGGLMAAVESIAERIEGEALPPPAPRAGEPGTGGSDAAASTSVGDLLPMILVAGMFGLLASQILGRLLGALLGSGLGALGSAVFLGSWGWAVPVAVALFILILLMGGVRGAPRGMRSAGGRRSAAPWVLPGGGGWGGSGGLGGGGFSGGGGGFGGGGASGDW